MENEAVKASILLVDDEIVIRKSLAKELKAEHYAVTDAGSGVDAIGALQKLQFNIVITDLMMEGIDGFGVLKAVKELSPLTRIIVITGYGDLRTAIDAMHLGADDFLAKPFEVEELLFRIRRCLEKRNLLEMLMEKTQQLEKEVQRRASMEAMLIESDNRYRLALDAASNGVWDHNLSTGKTFRGENWYRTLGYSQDETPDFEKIIHPDDRDRVMKAGEETINGKTRFFEAEFRLRNKAGEWQWVLSRGKVVEWDEQGSAVRLIGTITDIHRLKQLETRLIHAQKELREKVREQTDRLRETQLALQRVQHEAGEIKNAGEVRELVTTFIKRLEKTGLAEGQRGLVAGLREALEKFR